ncbi:multicopper oxidase [Apiospora rasikravindrae]|uniref:laccase n=1 Tax=Apiospora rasikravindrae TaxID=990691 RepID=A0ABR1TF83_9PEZI
MWALPSLTGIASISLFVSLCAAAPAPALEVSEIETRAASTCNTPDNRACWTDDFNLQTDYETSTPPAGSTPKTFDWEVTEQDNWETPDGRILPKVMLVNGQFPGPTLQANWGDDIVVNIKNSLRTNGTSFHWHGIRQFHNNIHDGANGVTECPLAPGKSKTYRWRATQYGTSWYHSHFSAQYGNGVWGPIVINGPSSDDWDIDLGPFPISDSYDQSADEIIQFTQTAGAPASNNVLFNGTNINPDDPTKGENNFHVKLVGHQFRVMATDMVPINPITTDSLFMGVGQRYDVMIDANQASGNYWFNVTFPESKLCGTSLNNFPAAIFTYADAADQDGLPTTQGQPPNDTSCQDSTDFSPVITRNAPDFALDPNRDLKITLDGPPFLWKVNGSDVNVDWDRPVLDYVLEGNTSYPRRENLYVVNERDVYTYWVIENQNALPHPMHLHGHDFLILGHSAPQGEPTAFSGGQLNLVNPTRRDVTMLPGNGWLVVAFRADNPGNWLFHCHIAWHVSSGLGVDFLERAGEQADQISAQDLAEYQQTCQEWRDYFPSQDPFPKLDSGI